MLNLRVAPLLLVAMTFAAPALAQAQTPPSPTETLATDDAAIAAARREAPGAGAPNAALARLLTERGNALLKLKRYDEAMTSFSEAATLSTNPAIAWFNLCATAYNMGKTDEAVRACDRAIAIDPTRADAWFVKGSALYGQGTLDKANHYVLPPGTLEALRQYLILAPDGPHAADVKAMLDAAK